MSELTPLGTASDDHDVCPCVLGRGAQPEPDRSGPSTATVWPGSIPARSTPCRQQASGSTMAATSGASTGGTGTRLRSAIRGHEQELGIRAVQERLEVLASVSSRHGVHNRRTEPSGRDHAAPRGDVDAAELVPEGAR